MNEKPEMSTGRVITLAKLALQSTADGSLVIEAKEAAEAAAEEAQEALEDIETAIAHKAEIDGYYDSMTVGNAEQLISNDYTTDSVPYTFRTAGGGVDVGDREFDELVGGTLAWNQLTYDGNFTSVDYWAVTNGSISVSDNVLTATCNYEEGTSGSNFYIVQKAAQRYPVVDGHKYFMCVDAKFSKDNSNTIWFRLYHTGTSPNAYSSGTTDYEGGVVADTWYHFAGIAVPARTDTKTGILIWPRTLAYEAGDTIELKNCMVIDLTQMFGTAIADYIYALETATPGAAEAWLKKLFPKDYYAYNAGTLQSVQAASHDMVGFNQWDEEWELGTINQSTGVNDPSDTNSRSKNYIPILPDTTYYAYFGRGTAANVETVRRIFPRYYDADKNYLGAGASVANGTFTTMSGAYYLRFVATNITTYENDICINLSWSGYRNGEYEPYEKHSYPLDSTLTLRGVPYLDASGNMVYDGDTYESDGTVTRRYGIVDLGTKTWTYNTSYAVPIFTHVLQSGFPYTDTTIKLKAICTKYINNYSGYSSLVDKSFTIYYGTTTGTGNPLSRIALRDDDYTDADTLKTALSGVYLVYEITTPTTETADPFQDPQIVSDFGTEEYVDAAVAAGTRDVAIPVGHETKYIANLVDKLRRLPDAPDAAGNYLVHYDATTRRMSCTEYLDGSKVTALEGKVPDAPSTDGTYVLTATVADGTATYSWEVQA